MTETDDPVTIALVAATGLQVAGTIQQGRAAEAEGEAAQQIAEQNARAAEIQGESEVRAGTERARRLQREARIFGGRQRVAIARGGVLATGSPVEVLADTAAQFALEEADILADASRRQLFAQSKAKGFRLQGRAALERGRNAKRASILTGIGQGIGGIAGAGLFGGGSTFNPVTQTSRRSSPFALSRNF